MQYSVIISIDAPDEGSAFEMRDELAGALEDARDSAVVPGATTVTGELIQGDVEAVLESYQRLHDGLSDMVEGGRLAVSDIPNDYQWLVESLASLANRVGEVSSLAPVPHEATRVASA